MTPTNLLDSILGKLEQVRTRRPELRLGQLIAIVGSLAEDETGHSLWDVEDADFLVALERFAHDLAHNSAGEAESASAPDRSGNMSTPATKPPQQVS